MRRDLDEVRSRMEGVRADPSTPDTRLSDDMNHLNPACTEALTRTMLGGLPTGRVGYPLHCQLRYFDPEARRAGLPPDVGSLVHAMDAEGIEVELVNLNVRESRTVQVQLGAYGEHAVADLRLVDDRQIDRDTLGERDSVFEVVLEPGCGGRLALGLARYCRWPTLAFPWRRHGSRERTGSLAC